MSRALTRRESEILQLALKRAADLELTAGNAIASRLLAETAEDIARRPLRVAS